MNKATDFDALPDVKFKIAKEAFSPKVAHCFTCKRKMKNTTLEIQIGNAIYARLEGFECSKCHKQSLGLAEAKKLDAAMIFQRAFTKNFKFERNLSFDGDNYMFRIPKEFTSQVHKRKVEIVPLGANEFCAVVE